MHTNLFWSQYDPSLPAPPLIIIISWCPISCMYANCHKFSVCLPHRITPKICRYLLILLLIHEHSVGNILHVQSMLSIWDWLIPPPPLSPRSNVYAIYYIAENSNNNYYLNYIELPTNECWIPRHTNHRQYEQQCTYAINDLFECWCSNKQQKSIIMRTYYEYNVCTVVKPRGWRLMAEGN